KFHQLRGHRSVKAHLSQGCRSQDSSITWGSSAVSTPSLMANKHQRLHQLITKREEARWHNLPLQPVLTAPGGISLILKSPNKLSKNQNNVFSYEAC
uniref:Uncharacterized protein n=1 Tax=Malurus cyaneus samueli TaxID=2593467 RepID=A0A8C5UHR9_9PASS